MGSQGRSTSGQLSAMPATPAPVKGCHLPEDSNFLLCFMLQIPVPFMAKTPHFCHGPRLVLAWPDLTLLRLNGFSCREGGSLWLFFSESGGSKGQIFLLDRDFSSVIGLLPSCTVAQLLISMQG